MNIQLFRKLSRPDDSHFVSLLSISLTLFKWKKKPWLRRKQSLPIFQSAYVRKVRPRARPGLSCRPPGQPGGRESWPAKKGWPSAGGGDSAWRENSQEYLKSCWGPQGIGCSLLSYELISRYKLYLATNFIYMNLDLTHSIKGQSCHISFIGIVWWNRYKNSLLILRYYFGVSL